MVGLNLLRLLQKVDKISEEVNDESLAIKNYDLPVIDNTAKHEKLRVEFQRNCHEDHTVKMLDRELFLLFKDNRPDREPQPALFGENFLIEIPVIADAHESQKQCFGENKMILRSWLVELKEWFNKLELVETSANSTCSDQCEVVSDSSVVTVEVTELHVREEQTRTTSSCLAHTSHETLLPQVEEAGPGTETHEPNKHESSNTIKSVQSMSKEAQRAHDQANIKFFVKVECEILLDCWEDLMKLPAASVPQGRTQKIASLLQYLQDSLASNASVRNTLREGQNERDERSSISESTKAPTPPTIQTDRNQPPDHEVNETGPESVNMPDLDQQRESIIALHEASWRLTQAIVFCETNQESFQEMLFRTTNDFYKMKEMEAADDIRKGGNDR